MWYMYVQPNKDVNMIFAVFLLPQHLHHLTVANQHRNAVTFIETPQTDS